MPKLVAISTVFFSSPSSLPSSSARPSPLQYCVPFYCNTRSSSYSLQAAATNASTASATPPSPVSKQTSIEYDDEVSSTCSHAQDLWQQQQHDTQTWLCAQHLHRRCHLHHHVLLIHLHLYRQYHYHRHHHLHFPNPHIQGCTLSPSAR